MRWASHDFIARAACGDSCRGVDHGCTFRDLSWPLARGMAGASTVLATLAVLATLIPKGPPAFTQAHTTHNDGSPQPLRHHALRGGGDEHGTVRAADHQLLGKRERAASRSPAGVSFQAVVDSEDAVRFFSAADLDTLRRQFVPLPTRTGAGGEGDGDTVPASLLGQLRLRISMRRDKYSRSLIKGEPMSVSEDDGTRLLEANAKPGYTGRDGGQNAGKVTLRDAHSLEPSTSTSVRAAVQAAVRRTKTVLGQKNVGEAAQNVAKPLDASAGVAASSDGLNVAVRDDAKHMKHELRKLGAEKIMLTPGMAGMPNNTNAPANLTLSTQKVANVKTDDGYIGWVGAMLVPLPGSSNVQPADGMCELVRVSGRLQVVTELGKTVGCVEPRQAKPLVAFLRASVPPGTIHCVLKTLHTSTQLKARAPALAATQASWAAAGGSVVQLEMLLYGSQMVRANAERLLVPSPLQTNFVGVSGAGFVGSTAVKPMDELQVGEKDDIALVNAGPSTMDWGRKPLDAQALVRDRETEEKELQNVLELRDDASGFEFESQMDELFDKGVHHDAMPEMEAPPSVKTRLLLHQRKALYWMVAREEPCKPMFWEPYYNSRTNTRGWFNTVTRSFSKTPPQGARGGILADEMGLGKTLAIISLVMRGVAARRKLLEGSVLPLSNATGPTLIVSPLSVLQNWVDQLQEHTDGSLRLYIYHGPGRTREPMMLMLYDVVLTTYSILGSEFIPLSKRDRNEAGSVLHCVRWSRVVLDEAHLIANRNSLQSKSVVALSSIARWAVTGTPIQNKLEDLYPLFAFLRLHPLDNYDYFLKLVIMPMRLRSPTSVVRIRKLLQIFCLRRTKEQRINGQPIIILPPKTIHVTEVLLSPQEKLVYQRVHLRGKELVGRWLQRSSHGLSSKGSSGESYAKMLLVLLRLRQFCDHPKLVASSRDMESLEGLRDVKAASVGDDLFGDLVDSSDNSGARGDDLQEGHATQIGRWKNNRECVKTVREFCESVMEVCLLSFRFFPHSCGLVTHAFLLASSQLRSFTGRGQCIALTTMNG